MLNSQNNDTLQWLAPYGYFIVFLGFTFFLFRIFENWYAAYYNKPLYRNLLIYKKLTNTQLSFLNSHFFFYSKLSDKEKRQFQHRVAKFISEKQFVGRQNFEITDKVKVLIAATACMLSFGRKNYRYNLIEYILVYPSEFYSAANENYHKGEFNPKEKALVLSWKDFEKGYKITDDNINLGIHECMHAMQLESMQGKDVDSIRFQKQFQNILKCLTNDDVKALVNSTEYFRKYAFTNQYEFMAVLVEYFIESPVEFNALFPEIYQHKKQLLNFTFADY
ncbi:zinc-dependent peptidase [Marixanthomonas sp. SCSIO 43207]|uniref:zinc-dependent peptidase n=1 Tax=Marixanthomonas sp. SCSIO 43207 TaxID=2779360 RepID=UPI001CAA22BF|nr:zinc-dependent peptidase [Marixanthomonas sp. SCSIO 43207]UAB81468.1 zinc-dependent peptidase [Marixanthomonas sp. SCSIO 43207]